MKEQHRNNTFKELHKRFIIITKHTVLAGYNYSFCTQEKKHSFAYITGTYCKYEPILSYWLHSTDDSLYSLVKQKIQAALELNRISSATSSVTFITFAASMFYALISTKKPILELGWFEKYEITISDNNNSIHYNACIFYPVNSHFHLGYQFQKNHCLRVWTLW